MTENNTFVETGDPRHLAICLEFNGITTKIFNPNSLPIADFIESLFNKEHIELSSVIFDGVVFL